MTLSRRKFTILIFTFSIPAGAFCGTKEFDGGGGADPNTGTGQSWGTSQNWRPDGTPISSDDVVFDNAFKATLQNVNLNAVNRVANSLTVDLTTNQTWNLGADAAAGNATLTLTTGSLTRNNEATNSSLVVIGATTGTGIGTGILTLATTAAGFTIANQDADASLLVQATISGSAKAVTYSGVGTVSLTGSSNNTYTGKTTVSAGLLALNRTSGTNAISSTGATGATAATTDLQITGGMVRLETSNQIVDSATVGLSGGTLKLNGVQEGTTAASGVGALTLSANSIIDLANTSLLHMAASGSQSWTGTLSIYNWTGSNSGGAAEQILFGNNDSSTSLTAAQLAMINFYSDSGTTFLGTAMFAGLNDGEIVPVPEAGSWATGILATIALVYSQQRRRMGVVRARATALPRRGTRLSDVGDAAGPNRHQNLA